MNWALALMLMVTAIPAALAAEGQGHTAVSARGGGDEVRGGATTTAKLGARARCSVALKKYRRHYGRTLAAVRAALKKHAPELLRQTPRAMPAVARPGYGVLPRLVAPRALGVGAAAGGVKDDAHLNGGMVYSWDLTAQYAAREVKALEEIEEKLAALVRLNDRGDRRAILKGVVDVDLPQLERGFSLVDRHEKHNVFWQPEIRAHRKSYEEGTRLFHLVREGKGGADVDRVRFLRECKAPIWVKDVIGDGGGGGFGGAGNSAKAIIVDIYTDISDRAWLTRFADAVARLWSVPGVTFHIQWKQFLPKPRPRAGAVLADEVAWVGHFPRKGAVLTTGATTTHALPCRAIVLGPFDLEETAAAHEFGHILGFGDTYIRGFRDLGPDDGLEILEIVPDASDLMAMPESGVVQPGHIEALLR